MIFRSVNESVNLLILKRTDLSIFEAESFPDVISISISRYPCSAAASCAPTIVRPA